MEFKVYRLTYYLNARHSMDNCAENAHSHTFHLSLLLEDIDNRGMLQFSEADRLVNHYLNTFSGEYLNGLEPFMKMLPTIENMGDYFYEALKELLIKEGFDLIQMDISENPLRIYSVSDRIYRGVKANW